MRKFLVTIKEIHERYVTVLAENQEAAVIAVAAGKGDASDETEYVRTMDRDSWTVEDLHVPPACDYVGTNNAK